MTLARQTIAIWVSNWTAWAKCLTYGVYIHTFITNETKNWNLRFFTFPLYMPLKILEPNFDRRIWDRTMVFVVSLYEQGSKFEQWAVPINRFLYSITVQNFTHLSYSFRVTTPIIGAGHSHGPKRIRQNVFFFFGFLE